MKRPAFAIIIRAEPGVDPARALKPFLKAALRRFGPRCVSLAPVDEEREP